MRILAGSGYQNGFLDFISIKKTKVGQNELNSQLKHKALVTMQALPRFAAMCQST